jgi:hypothetical protein
VPLAIDREEDFIQMPCVAGSGTPALELIGIGLPELQTLLPNGFIRDEDPTGEQQLLDIAIAEAETEIQPHRMTDDLDREAVILVGVDRWCVHAPSMAHQVNARQAAQQVDNASPLPEGEGQGEG